MFEFKSSINVSPSFSSFTYINNVASLHPHDLSYIVFRYPGILITILSLFIHSCSQFVFLISTTLCLTSNFPVFEYRLVCLISKSYNR